MNPNRHILPFLLLVLLFNCQSCGIFKSEPKDIIVKGQVKDKVFDTPISNAVISLTTSVPAYGIGGPYTKYVLVAQDTSDANGYFSISHSPQHDDYEVYFNLDYDSLTSKSKYRGGSFKVNPGANINRIVYLNPTAVLFLKLETSNPLSSGDTLQVYEAITIEKGLLDTGSTNYYRRFFEKFKPYDLDFYIKGNSYSEIRWDIKRTNETWKTFIDSVYCPYLTVTQYTINY